VQKQVAGKKVADFWITPAFYIIDIRMHTKLAGIMTRVMGDTVTCGSAGCRGAWPIDHDVLR
jgi:hypothetical protein